MIRAMSVEIATAVLSTPPAATYPDFATPCLPALRGEGQSWFGVVGLPSDVRAALRDEDLAWLRTGEALRSLTKQEAVGGCVREGRQRVAPRTF